MQYVVRDRDADSAAPLGGKARALAVLGEAGFPVPPWAVVLPVAFEASVGPGRVRQMEQAALDGVELARPVLDELGRVLGELGGLVAVRSSASDEDGAQHSFAGQLESYLFVPPGEVPRRILDVWRSGSSDRILAYRREHGLPPAPRPPAVLVQKMVDADAAGVAFGADPVSGRRGVAVVSAVFGLGTALVSGEADADTWHVDRDGSVVGRHIADKKVRHAAAPGNGEGVRPEPVPPERSRTPALSDEQVRAVADLARRCGRRFGWPQDIEWAVAGGRLYLLQSRPITSLAGRPDPDGVVNLWDNSNIAESYNGITTPLTFSFARRIYEEVYRQFCRMLRVPESVIEARGDVFRRMLGLVRGTVYYNLLNWYRLLAMLPGFKANRGFMEQMMGVKEALPDNVAPAPAASTWMERLGDRLRLAGSVRAMVFHHLTLRGQIKRFYARLGAALGKTRPDLDRLRPDEIVGHYREIESQLLKRWDAPLLNDFFAMIFFGVLGKLTRRWCGQGHATLQNDLLCGEGGMISAEPARRVREMALAAVPHPALVAALCAGGPREVAQALTDVDLARSENGLGFRRLYEQYLERFGDRCLEELKLESSTLFDDPTPLWRSVGQLARRLSAGPPPPPSNEAGVRKAAEEQVKAALGSRPLRRVLFRWVLKHARARVRDRENLRFERTRLFGRVRMIFVALGKQFHALGLLDDPRDVFYLEQDEVLDFVEGTAACADLRGLAAVRKAEFDRYRELPRPGDRFETRGLVYVGHRYERSSPQAEPAGGEERWGLGCCPGVVRGRVRVITNPRGAELHHGEVLVAERTDPGWIMLFPSAAGLLVERGSLLSHSAIVAREMGIPAVVSLADATRWLRTGDEVELDGGSGRVRRLAQAPGGEP
jgi:pyruvate,water dikinase